MQGAVNGEINYYKKGIPVGEIDDQITLNKPYCRLKHLCHANI